MSELSNSGAYIRMPVDYEPTQAEKDQTRKQDEAEAAALKAKGKAGKGKSAKR